MKKTITGYMCPIDFQWELGEAAGGTVIYASIEDLKKNHTCWEECGIIEVEVTNTKVVVETKPFSSV